MVKYDNGQYAPKEFAMDILVAENLTYSYDKTAYALKGVSLTAKEGEYLCVIGHNGSGKSTLAKIFNGLIKPDEGTVTVDGLSLAEKKNLFEIRKRVGVVFQNPDNQLVASIVEDDVAFGPENLGVPRKEIGERIDFALKAVDMEKFRSSSPERLSGGQKQRIAIAGVLALKPKILVLDESTAMLDPQGRKEILSVVKKLNKEQGVTVIAITHYMDEVLDADRVIVLNDGEIVLNGTPEQIFSDARVIKGYGLELPLASFVAEKLKEQGLDLADGITDKDALTEGICKLL